VDSTAHSLLESKHTGGITIHIYPIIQQMLSVATNQKPLNLTEILFAL
jgi:hypothetical protein